MKRNIPLIVGNWKLNPQTTTEANALAAGVGKYHKQVEAPYVGIAPGFLYLQEIKK